MLRVMRWLGWLLLLSIPVLLGIGISQLVRGNVAGVIPMAFSSVSLGLGILALVSAWRVGIRARRGKLLHTGAPGLGTIQVIKETGYSVNDNPEVRLSLRVVPEDGSAPFESAGSTMVSRVDLPRVGQQVPVRYNPADHGEVAIAGPVETPPEPLDHAPTTTALSGVLDDLERLSRLRQSGAINDEEFAALKARIDHGDE